MFSCDVMLSSNMAASIAAEINIHLMQSSFYIIVHVGFSMSFSIRGSSPWSPARMVRVTAMDIQVSLRDPMAMLEDSMTSVKMLYTITKIGDFRNFDMQRIGLGLSLTWLVWSKDWEDFIQVCNKLMTLIFWN